MQKDCWSLRCSLSIACRRCSNYIFILDLTHGFNVLGKDHCKTRRETLVLESGATYIRDLTVAFDFASRNKLWYTPRDIDTARGLCKFVVVWYITIYPYPSRSLHWRCGNPLQWRHNGRDGVLNHQHHDCLLNRLFRGRSKKTSQLRVTGLCEGNSPVTGEFPTQRASNAENVSIWWRHPACN